ncbi:hypothetical protein N0V90_010323 [Kalmusia sp. IMI 367209]|nr:hypothetical protein N0V90_010323 [Kalmusia sp. IMI 367209]
MSTAKLISSTTDLGQMLAKLNTSPTVPPHLYIDLEGVSLSRHGSVSILTLYDRSTPTNVYLIDVHTLGALAFTTPAAAGECPKSNDKTCEYDMANLDVEMEDVDNPPVVTLHSILESDSIPKVFFDVRNDSDALFAHFGIKLQGIIDLQLMELATRGGSGRFSDPLHRRDHVNGLAKCIQYGAGLSFENRKQVQVIKDRGTNLFAPERGGSYIVFNLRPLHPDLVRYCVQDVVHMPALWNTYNNKMKKIQFWGWVVSMETMKRIEESWSANYVPQGKHKSIGWSWEYLLRLESLWNGARS